MFGYLSNAFANLFYKCQLLYSEIECTNDLLCSKYT